MPWGVELAFAVVVLAIIALTLRPWRALPAAGPPWPWLAWWMLLPVALATALMSGLGWVDGLHRLVWLGLVPATPGMSMGAALRRWWPNHLFVCILGRGFFASALAGALAGAISAWLEGLPALPGGLDADDLALGRWLAAWGDAWLSGMPVAIFVAFRPEWLATYTDRLYLPAAPRPDGKG